VEKPKREFLHFMMHVLAADTPHNHLGKEKSYPIENIDIYLVLQAADAPKIKEGAGAFAKK